MDKINLQIKMIGVRDYIFFYNVDALVTMVTTYRYLSDFKVL